MFSGAKRIRVMIRVNLANADNIWTIHRIQKSFFVYT